jgi:hypothetical protein
MKTNTFRILFFLKKTKPLKNGEFPCVMRLTVNGERAEVSTSRSIRSNIWDQKKGRALGNTPKSNSGNNFLDNKTELVYQYKRNFELYDQEVSARSLKDQLQGRGNVSSSLVALFEDHNAQMWEKVPGSKARETALRYDTTLKHVRDFMKTQYHVNDIPINLCIIFIHKYLRTIHFLNFNLNFILQLAL